MIAEDGRGITAKANEELDTTDINQHVYAYLDFFLARKKNPNFAVLISGSWGIGKTFLVRRYLDAHQSECKKRYLYVSLYGLASAEEINEAVVEALFPMVANKGVQIAGKLAAAVAKKFIELPKVNYVDLVSQFGDMTIVFDDLERCKLEPAAALGFINRYVEHDSCSVIILAYESEIKNRIEYERVKEKVVGKTLAIVPSFIEALGVFIAQLNNADLRRFLTGQQLDLQAIYHASGTQNLRTLFQVILDYERVWEAVDPKFRSSPMAMAALLELIAALSFELKSGGIKSGDLVDRHVNWLVAYLGDKTQKDLTPWQKACQKYPTSDLQGGLLSDNVLTDILVRGEVKAIDINACLALSSFFVGEEEPAWRTLWYSFYRSEQALMAALPVFEREFSENAFTIPGIILHAFGLKLMLAGMGLGAHSRAAAAKACVAYIDRLEAAGALEPLRPGVSTIFDTSYDGLSFTEGNSSDFRDIWVELRKRQNKIYNDLMPQSANELLSEMETNPALFWRRINHNDVGDQLYADVPIFAFYDPEKFVDRLQALEPPHQNTIVQAIASRYDHNALDLKLADEKPWVQSICRCLMERAEQAPPFTRSRIHVQVKNILAPKIGLTF